MSLSRLHSFQFQKQILKLFTNNPMLCNSCTGLMIFTSGDVLSQYIKNNYQWNHQINFSRALQTGTLGIFMNGLMLHYWYRSLDYLFGSSMKHYGGVLVKVAMDQIVYAPFSIGVFFSMASISKGGDSAMICDRLKEKTQESFLDTWAADCLVWPLVNFLNFRFIPISLRPTFVGAAQLMWQTYMSTVGYRDCQPLPDLISPLTAPSHPSPPSSSSPSPPPSYSPSSVALN
jgi:hypothetical protein